MLKVIYEKAQRKYQDKIKIVGENLFNSFERIEIVENIKCVDQVIPETAWEQKVKDIKKYEIDIFAMGNDWVGKFDFLSKYCQVIYLPRTENISSTDIKKQMDAFLREHSIEL